MRIFLALVLCFGLIGCATMGMNQRFWEASDAGKFKIGMTKQELIAAIGYPPSSTIKPDMFFSQYTKTSYTPEGKEEEWIYETGVVGFTGGINYCTFYFKNDKLIKVEEFAR